MATDDLFNKLGYLFSKSTQALKDRFTLDNTDLLRAVDANDVGEVERALNAGVNPNKDDGMGRIALPEAVDNQNLAIVELLLKAKANPNLSGPDGSPPLFKAVYWESLTITKALLAAGADIYQPNLAGVSPFEEAGRNQNVSLLELMQQKYDSRRAKQVEADKAKHQELKAKAHAAREAQHTKEQAETEREQQRQEQAALRARQQAESALQKKYTFKAGEELVALVQTIQRKDSEALRLLLEKVEDVDAIEENSGLSPLMAALRTENGEAAQRLLNRGADIFKIVPSQKHSPLTYAVSQNYHKLVDLMLRGQSDVASQLNAPGQLLSPQFLAYKDAKMFDLLLAAGADPFFGGQAAPAPVVKALEKASVAILPVLALHKVPLNQLVEGRSLLSWAVEYGRPKWLIGLLKEGADADLRDADGRTPLLAAIEANRPEFVQVLLEEHADASLKDAKGRTALELSKALGAREEIIRLLEFK